ncbi:group 1 glycosyl transferase [Scytonema sp. HK-05]|uniref:glycosyltransferase family 4 protein n=1 Tax=Scytonema sp. HK-05 TaxID=1137095 RepID=UPI000937B45D|nr:glycosyltransferase family 4 protein [Scytonema sp. HK-05]OKH46052.1 glycosyltransferase WbuB [Scytonema sp. HK-05]BAY42987.1 group 1 glycosyl transferase [Scytonema sp. HK-05]
MKQQLCFLAGGPRISTHPYAEMSGPRSRILGLIKGFESLDWQVKPFIVGDRYPKKWSAMGSGEAISSGFFRTLAVDIVRLGLGVVNTWRSWRELGNQVDWVYEYAATLQSLGWIFQWHGIPWILQAEALLFYEAKVERKALVLDGIAQWLEIWAYRKCDVLACVSETLKEILVRDFNIPAEKIVLVPNGVDTDFINPERHSAKRVFTGFTVGFVGSLYAWAGLDLLLEALSELRSQGMDLSLVVVGDGFMKADWETYAHQLGLSSNVAFIGQVPWSDVPQYISGFDVGYSGQVQLQMGKMYLSPMKLYEYMAMAKPVIASAFEDAQRLVCEGKTGFLFRPGDKDDLKRALVEAFHQRAVLPSMGYLARKEIETNHSWTARVQALVEGVEQILKKRL